MGCAPCIEIRLILGAQGGDRLPGDGRRPRLGAPQLSLISAPRTDHAGHSVRVLQGCHWGPLAMVSGRAYRGQEHVEANAGGQAASGTRRSANGPCWGLGKSVAGLPLGSAGDDQWQGLLWAGACRGKHWRTSRQWHPLRKWHNHSSGFRPNQPWETLEILGRPERFRLRWP